MAKFRKKPVVIEAVQVSEVLASAARHTNPRFSDLPDWVRQASEACIIALDDDHVHISTAEGIMTGNRGDFIIRGVKGELYPCKPDIFAATYDPADQFPSDEQVQQAREILHPH